MWFGSKRHPDTGRPRIIYETTGVKGAFGFIDQGFVSGYRSLEVEALEWHAATGPDLAQVLREFRPTHFIGNFQGPDRLPAAWLRGGTWKKLLRYKRKHGLRVALRSLPSNLRDLTATWPIDFSQFPERGVQAFYQQPDRPLPEEAAAINSGFVDLIRSPLAHHVYEVCFRSFIDLGVPILEEPHAADTTRYQPVETEKTVAVQFIGGCWPFKLHNMAPYIDALREAFGDAFRLYGQGWPDSYGAQPLDNADFDRAVGEAVVNISLHEPTQVLELPFSGNERVFKLLALEACVVSDPNPLLGYHLDVPSEVRLAASPEEMVAVVRELVDSPSAAQAMGLAGRAKVLAKHTYARRAQRVLDLLDRLPDEKIIRYTD